MKQHITVDDLNQLTDNGKEKLRTWWIPQDGDSVLFRGEEQLYYHYEYDGSDQVTIEDWELKNTYPLLSIGQMIEFLQTFKTDKRYKNGYPTYILFFQENNGMYHDEWYIRPDTLCDDLWSSCVEILNK